MAPRGRVRTPLWFLALTAVLVGATVSAGVPAKKPDAGLFRRVLRSSVWVVVRGEALPAMGRFKLGTGTGWVLDLKRRLIVTNRHVVRDQKQVRVFFPAFVDGRLTRDRNYYKSQIPRGGGIPGTVVATEVKRDLALVELDFLPEGAAALPLAAASPQPGQQVYSLGNPGANPDLWQFAAWTILGVGPKKINSRQGQSSFLLDTTVILSTFLPELPPSGGPGASGGPLVNACGQVVGIAQGQTEREGKRAGVFIEVSALRLFLEDNRVVLKKLAPRTVAGRKKAKPARKPAPRTQEDPAERDEKLAAAKLRLAQLLDDSGKKDKAKHRYQDIITAFPKTAAAKKAKELLANLNKK